MNRKIISVLIVLAILASGITACSSEDSYLILVMKIAPEDTIVISCNDYEAAAEDSDFEFMYDTLETVMGNMTVGNMIDGVDVSDVSASAVMRTIGNDIVYVLIGDLNLEDIRDALIEDGWIEDVYEGMEIWTYYDYKAIAFIDNMIISGYTDLVEACISAHKNKEPSMYDNEDTRSVADKLLVVPSSVVASGDFTPIELAHLLADIEYLAYSVGVSNENRDDEVLDVSAWFRFDSEASAEAAMEDIEDIPETGVGGYISINARLNGQYIEITAEMEIP